MKEHAREHGVDAGAIGAYGYSAGGHLAALLAAERAGAVEAVVAGGAPCDLEAFGSLAYLFGGTRDETPQAYRLASPLAHVSGDEPPMLFFHGAADRLVPRRQPERMVAALRAAGVEADLDVVPWAGHILAAASPTALARATGFFRAKLAARARLFRGRPRRLRSRCSRHRASGAPSGRALPA